VIGGGRWGVGEEGDDGGGAEGGGVRRQCPMSRLGLGGFEGIHR
jgi:hypothetical protein